MEDPRFGDLAEPGCEPLRDKVLSYIHPNATHGVKSKKKTESFKARKARADWLDARMKENDWTVNKLGRVNTIEGPR
jgi:hypothetical protein